MRSSETLDLRLATGYRHCAIGLLLTAVFLTPSIYRALVTIFNLPYSQSILYVVYVCVLPPSLLVLFLTYNWRMRIDEKGVHRRILDKWRHWPWSLFEGRRVRRGKGYYDFEVDEHQVISFRLADEDMARQALHMCYARWHPPPPRLLPQVVTLKASAREGSSWWEYRSMASTVRATSAGLGIDVEGDVPTHSWSEVKKVVIFRPSLEHEVCDALYFQVGEREWQVDHSWNRPILLEVSAFFERYAWADVVVVCTEDPPETVAEIEEWLAHIRIKKRQLSAGSIVFAAFMGAFNLIFLDFSDPMTFFLILMLLLSIAHPLYKRRRHQLREKELIALRESWDEQRCRFV